VRLRTARLSLRPLGADDLDVILRIHRDPELMAEIHRGVPHDRAECHDDLERCLSTWRTRGFGTFVVEQPRSGDLVGTVGFGQPAWCPPAMPGPDIGWTILQPHQRQGYATEAAAALIGWFFDAGRGHRLVGIHNTSNPRSGAVMGRLGMRWWRRIPHPELGYPIELWDLTATSWSAARLVPAPRRAAGRRREVHP
jgi:RimJ/RimL family protein N-acetyltransferase